MLFVFVLLMALPVVQTSFVGSHYMTKDDRLCSELMRFVPNLCDSTIAKSCYKFCGQKGILDCGKRPPVKTRRRRIVGGEKSSPGEWPWQVSLRMNGTQWCAGAILSYHFVLTAGHCFDEQFTSKRPQDWKVHAGDHHLSKTDKNEQDIQVRKIIIHKKFDYSIHVAGNKYWATVHNDVAILQLDRPIIFQHSEKASICLPDNNQKIPETSECYVVGWGHTSFNGTQPDELRHAKVFLVPNAICNMEKAYNKTINPKELLCAGYKEGGIDACNYDSGGAMVCKKQGLWYATGIVSSGFECARPHSYGLYTNVAEYKEWIIENILTGAD